MPSPIEGEDGENCKILLCGPPPMMAAMMTHFKSLNYRIPQSAISQPSDYIYKF